MLTFYNQDYEAQVTKAILEVAEQEVERNPIKLLTLERRKALRPALNVWIAAHHRLLPFCPKIAGCQGCCCLHQAPSHGTWRPT